MAPLPRYKKLPEAKRKRLVEVAQQEFAAFGFDQASLNRIIKASGMSKGAMYYYFADKEDLFAEVLYHALEQFGTLVGPMRPSSNREQYWANVEELIDRFETVSFEHPDLVAVGRAIYAGGGGGRALAHCRARAEAWVCERLAEGQALGAVRDDVPLELLATALTGMMMGIDRWVVENWERHDPAELERLLAKLHRLCQDLAAPR